MVQFKDLFKRGKKLLAKERSYEKLFVLGLDGVSLPFALQAAESGFMPNLATILGQGAQIALKPIIPTVSTVAWSDYMTGVNPGKHGVFGFVDRVGNPFSVHIPTAQDLKVPTMWELLSRAGKQVAVVNLPLTYPPKQVNGIMVGGFLSPELAKATFPVELAPRLMEFDYRIDADTSLAMSDRNAFLEDLEYTLSRRFTAGFELMRSYDWDIFHLHIMSTDRMNHFFWPGEGDDQEEAARIFWTFYQKLDAYLGELLEQLPGNARLALVSDHGFAANQGCVYLNQWLEQNGYLIFGRGKRELINMHPESKAYSLAPGRVFINLEGREQQGGVAQGNDYEELREELIHRLGGLCHPEGNQPLVAGVYRREDLYQGPQLAVSADLIVDPMPGYDLKANLDGPGVVGPPDIPGVHTGQGTFLHISGIRDWAVDEGQAGLMDVPPTLMAFLGVAPPPSMDGRSLV